MNGLWSSYWGSKIVFSSFFFASNKSEQCVLSRRKENNFELTCTCEVNFEWETSKHGMWKMKKMMKINDTEWKGMADTAKHKSIKTSLWFQSTVEYERVWSEKSNMRKLRSCVAYGEPRQISSTYFYSVSSCTKVTWVWLENWKLTEWTDRLNGLLRCVFLQKGISTFDVSMPNRVKIFQSLHIAQKSSHERMCWPSLGKLLSKSLK